jgi:hypothetical protein
MKRFRTSKSDGQLLIIKSRLLHFLELAFLLGFIAWWYWNLLQDTETNPSSLAERLAGQPDLWLSIFAPFLMLPQVLRAAKAIAGEIFIFDRRTNRLLRNQTFLCPMNLIDFAQIRTFHNENSAEYRVAIVCKDGSKHRIAEGSGKEALFDLAEEIADYAGVKVVHK